MTHVCLVAAADRFPLIDESAPDDGDALTASVTGTRDLFSLAAPASVPQVAHAVVVNVRSRRTDVGAKSLRPFLRINGAEDIAADPPLPAQPVILQHPVSRNPDAGAAWTGADLASLEGGIEVGA